MDETKPNATPDQPERQDNLDEGGCPATQAPAQEIVIDKASEAGAPNVGPQQPQDDGGGEDHEVCQKLLNWLKGPSPTDWLVVLFTLFLSWIAYRQIALLSESNKIAGSAAAAAESAAKAAEQSIKMTEAGEETTKQTAEATQATANATKATADAIKAAAQAARDSVELTKKANETAEKAANAAKDAALAAEASNTIAGNTAQNQLRAYMHIATEDRPKLFFDAKTKLYWMELKVRNAGQTPAYKVRSLCSIAYYPASESMKNDPDKLAITDKGGMTVGPGGGYTLAGGRLPFKKTNEIVWVFGRIEYIDAFKQKRHTNFRYREGPPVPGTVNTFDLTIVDQGNDST